MNRIFRTVLLVFTNKYTDIHVDYTVLIQNQITST